MAADPRPDDAAIRRALAECMTATDIDDAMGWAPGTARRRRWRAPDRGGLPNADAELGGTALWFRSTVEDWQTTRTPSDGRGRPPDDRRPAADAVALEQDTQPGPRSAAEPRSQAETTPVEPVHDEAAGVDHQVVGAQVAGLRSGFELELGQRVLAEVHGRWREARVCHRDRATVVVDYNLDDTPRGARRQRITIARVHLPTDG